MLINNKHEYRIFLREDKITTLEIYIYNENRRYEIYYYNTSKNTKTYLRILENLDYNIGLAECNIDIEGFHFYSDSTDQMIINIKKYLLLI